MNMPWKTCRWLFVARGLETGLGGVSCWVERRSAAVDILTTVFRQLANSLSTCLDATFFSVSRELGWGFEFGGRGYQHHGR